MSSDEGRRPIRRALLSVYDKTGLVDLARALHAAGVQIVSTGTTASTVEQAGLPVTRVEELTGFPECLDGRVKTLHPRVHAGLLADLRLPAHADQLRELEIEPFDLLVSNLYPFSQTVASGAGEDECVEKIDIGGPAMVRAAAKNHQSVAVVTAAAAYPLVLDALQRVASRCSSESCWPRGPSRTSRSTTWPWPTGVRPTLAPSEWPEFAGLALRRESALRYGENPHQQAALYLDPNAPAGLAQAEQLHGREMSYNNYVDADAAWRSANDFAEPCVAIIKHANPCGIAVGADVAEAHRKAHACDPVSAFGGVIAVNREVTAELAGQLDGIFTEVIVAPSFDGRGARHLPREEEAAGAGRSGRGPRRPPRSSRSAAACWCSWPTGSTRPATTRPTGRWPPARPASPETLARSRLRLAGDPQREEQRDPAGARRRHRGRGHGPGQPGRRRKARGRTGPAPSGPRAAWPRRTRSSRSRTGSRC